MFGCWSKRFRAHNAWLYFHINLVAGALLPQHANSHINVPIFVNFQCVSRPRTISSEVSRESGDTTCRQSIYCVSDPYVYMVVLGRDRLLSPMCAFTYTLVSTQADESFLDSAAPVANTRSLYICVLASLSIEPQHSNEQIPLYHKNRCTFPGSLGQVNVLWRNKYCRA